MYYTTTTPIPIGQRLQVLVEGNPESPAVLLCQNFGASKSVWDQLAQILVNANFRVIRYENLGSPNITHQVYGQYYTPNNLTWDHFIQDLNGVLESLRLDSCVFVGHSLACMVGALASMRFPNLFSKLIFINPTVRYDNDEEAGYVGGITAEMTNALLTVLENNHRIWLDELPFLHPVEDVLVDGVPPEEHAGVHELCRPLFAQGTNPRIVLNLGRSIFNNLILGLSIFDRITLPCYVTQSERDKVVPRAATEVIRQKLSRESRKDVPSVVQYLPTNGHYKRRSTNASRLSSRVTCASQVAL